MMSVLWPLASMTTFARTSRSGSFSGFTRTPTAFFPSKITSSTRAPSWTFTPFSRAWSRWSLSNSLRTTCHVWLDSCGLLSQK
jgi:hypothetical protein